MRLANLLGRRHPAGADRPDWLVGDHQSLVRSHGIPDGLDLHAQHELHLAGFALLQRLPDAGDHPQAVLESRDRAPGDRLVRLAEVLTPLGMADDRARDTELHEHGRRDLARVGAVAGPVDVLREDRVAALDGGRK